MTATVVTGGLPLPPDSLAAALVRAEAVTVALRDITTLKTAAEAVLEAAGRAGCHNLVAASRSAEPLATAAALLSDGAIRFSDRVHSDFDKVLVVDAATVTGNATRECAAYLRSAGASWVGALIYDRVRPDLDGLDSDGSLDLVTSLAPSLA